MIIVKTIHGKNTTNLNNSDNGTMNRQKNFFLNPMLLILIIQKIGLTINQLILILKLNILKQIIIKIKIRKILLTGTIQIGLKLNSKDIIHILMKHNWITQIKQNLQIFIELIEKTIMRILNSLLLECKIYNNHNNLSN